MLDERLTTTDSATEGHFRARLKARDGVRPQSTLAILAGLDPKKATPEVLRGPVRMTPVSVAARPIRTAPPPRPEPAPVLAREIRQPEPAPIIPPPAAPARESVIRAPAPIAPPPQPQTRPEVELKTPQPLVGEDQDDGDEGRSYAQIAFAGLAVLGLAGLSFMAVDHALNGNRAADPEGDTGTGRSADTSNTALAGISSVSATAIQEAALPAGADPVAWFDYRGVADHLKARVEAFQQAEREAARQLELDAERLAANALAEAEAQRLAAAAQAVIDAEASAAAAALAERESVARAEADRIAALEAERLAEAEAALAAARAEADRVAALEAERAAQALAEQQRLAEIEAQRAAEIAAREQAALAARKAAADAEARRLAEIEAQRQAAAAEERRLAEIEAQRAADAEAQRLAALEAQRAAEAAEARRLAELEAQRLAAAARAERQAQAEAAAQAAATASAPTLAAVVLPPAPVAKPSLPPGAASLKPAFITEAAAIRREPPPALIATNPEVRPLGADIPAMPRTADAFMADRVALTSSTLMPAYGLAGLKAQFLNEVATAEDGALKVLTTPDGRSLEISIERTMMRAPSTRAYSEPAPVSVSVMCRDVAYALPGQERGRFAACRGADGNWVLARPSEPDAGPA